MIFLDIQHDIAELTKVGNIWQLWQILHYVVYISPKLPFFKIFEQNCQNFDFGSVQKCARLGFAKHEEWAHEAVETPVDNPGAYRRFQYTETLRLNIALVSVCSEFCSSIRMH